MSKNNNLTRREFFKDAAIAGAAVAATTVLGPTQALASIPIPKKWNYEADVVIVGAGTAGPPAAIEAIRAGAKTLVLETEPMGGGSYLVSGGITWFWHRRARRQISMPFWIRH